MSVFSEIENLSAAELKAQREELAKKLLGEEKVKNEAVVLRYLQARIDAKLRDEKMKEQGLVIDGKDRLIESLQETISQHLKNIRRMESEIEQQRSIIGQKDKDVGERDKGIILLQERVSVANEETKQIQKLYEAAMSLAKQRRVCLVDLMGLVSSLQIKIAPLLVEE